MLRARTVRSSTSCRESIRRVARVFVQGAVIEDLNHDFLWRTSRVLPSAGTSAFLTGPITKKCCGKVHPEILGNERISEELIEKDIWQKRVPGHSRT